MSKKRLISENNIVFVMNDVESKADSEDRDRVLQLQIGKLLERIKRLEKGE